jgi:hypothetical protein
MRMDRIELLDAAGSGVIIVIAMAAPRSGICRQRAGRSASASRRRISGSFLPALLPL